MGATVGCSVVVTPPPDPGGPYGWPHQQSRGEGRLPHAPALGWTGRHPGWGWPAVNLRRRSSWHRRRRNWHRRRVRRGRPASGPGVWAASHALMHGDTWLGTLGRFPPAPWWRV